MSEQLPDFDTMLVMAKHNPQGLEQLRQRLVSELIDNAAPAQRRRLEGLQFQIDMERRRAANPLAACVKLSMMMRDSLVRLQQALSEPEPERPALVSARVLRFTPAFNARSFEHSSQR